jgi:hypothetical protein
METAAPQSSQGSSNHDIGIRGIREDMQILTEMPQRLIARKGTPVETHNN